MGKTAEFYCNIQSLIQECGCVGTSEEIAAILNAETEDHDEPVFSVPTVYGLVSLLVSSGVLDKEKAADFLQPKPIAVKRSPAMAVIGEPVTIEQVAEAMQLK